MDRIRTAMHVKLGRRIDAMWWCGMLGIVAMTFLTGKWGEGSIWGFLCWATSIVIGVSVAGIVTWYFLVRVLFDVIAEVREDVNLGNITCRKITCAELDVVCPDGTKAVRILTFEGGGRVEVHGKDDSIIPGVVVEAFQDGGRVRLENKFDSRSRSSSTIAATERGASIVVGRNNRVQAAMESNEHGGSVETYARSGTQVAGMGVDENWNGVVFTWDYEGSRTANLSSTGVTTVAKKDS